jgi:alkanesulfonate monooxygenase SsuD/methylene tetrahydromethanopterin reductase-like flavin-dependent oxidoreductase (luciferase family)
LFGRKHAAPLDELYAEASDYVDVVRRLSDSWEDDAIIRDQSTGRYIDREKVHYIDYEGRFFSVRGPSITPRSPQAQPVLAADANSAPSIAFAAAHADLVFITTPDIDAARRTYADVLAAVAAAGRDESDVTVLALVDILLADTDAAAADDKSRLDALAGETPTADALEFIGTPSGLAELFADWSGAVDGFVVRPLVLPLGLTQLVEAVVPELRRMGLTRAGYSEPTLRGHFGLARPRNRYARSNP